MVRIILSILFLFVCTTAHSQQGGSPRTLWQEKDGSPSLRPTTITVDNGTIISYDGTQMIYSRWVATPDSVGSSGVAGTTAYDENYLYVCILSNSWKRISMDTWTAQLLLEDGSSFLLEDGTYLTLEY